MSWRHNFWKHGHKMFLVFIELKISGNWSKPLRCHSNLEDDFMVSTGTSEVEIIAPDGLRRRLSFDQDATIAVTQNILTYDPEKVEEITVDEKEQAGKGKTREILS